MLSLCMACVDRAEKESVKVKASKKDFIFKIESWGQLKPVQMLKTACLLMDKKTAEFEKEFKKAK